MSFQHAKTENESLILSSDPKSRLKWTPELHQLFIDAINQLGGADRATPKSLKRIMGIHGLTLYHLKSHLQKYRLGKNQNSLARGQNEQDYKENERSQTMGQIREGDQAQAQSNEALEISQALQIQMEVQRNLFQQVEVQKHLQLRIEAQGKYLQSVLQKAQETLALYNSSSSGIESTKAEVSKLVSMDCPGSSLSLLTELEGSLPENTKSVQPGTNGCSLESSLTSSENSKRKDDDVDDQERIETSNLENLKGDSTSLSYMEMNSIKKTGSNLNRGENAIEDDNDAAQQFRKSRESKTFNFLESLDLNTNV